MTQSQMRTRAGEFLSALRVLALINNTTADIVSALGGTMEITTHASDGTVIAGEPAATGYEGFRSRAVATLPGRVVTAESDFVDRQAFLHSPAAIMSIATAIERLAESLAEAPT